jgi:hypothetical protein
VQDTSIVVRVLHFMLAFSVVQGVSVMSATVECFKTVWVPKALGQGRVQGACPCML